MIQGTGEAKLRHRRAGSKDVRGLAAVIVFMKRSVMNLVFCSFLAVPVLAQGPFCNQFLVPVPLGEHSGANGSLWSNELWIRNDADSPRLVTQRTCVQNFHGCQFVSVSDTMPPRSTMKLIPLPGSEDIVDGQFVYVDDPTDMFFGLRTRDMNTTSAGRHLNSGGVIENRKETAATLECPGRPPISIHAPCLCV